MKTRFLLLFIAPFIAISAFSQSNLNNYKYVIVPKKYDFLKEENQYRLNGLTKFLFEKNGFEAVMEGDDYPQDMIANRCLALKSNVTKDSGLFKTKLTVELKDCNDKVVFTSQLGESREKEYDKAYNEALRNAFESFEDIGYNYSPDASATASQEMSQPKADNTTVTKEIEELKAEIASLRKEKQTEVEEAKVNEPKEKIIVAKPVVVEPPINVQVVSNKPDVESTKSILYAQATEQGFQLVDSSPKVIYKIIKTGINNVFLVEGLSAIIYKEGNSWIVEQHSEGATIKETLNIKF